jgi:hypothetical protein
MAGSAERSSSADFCPSRAAPTLTARHKPFNHARHLIQYDRPRLDEDLVGLYARTSMATLPQRGYGTRSEILSRPSESGTDPASLARASRRRSRLFNENGSVSHCFGGACG